MRLRIALVAAVAATLGGAGMATAAPPTTTSIDYVNDTRVVPAGAPFCDFPIVRVRDGRLWTRTYTAADGTVTRVQRWVSAYTYSLSNPANGKILLAHLGGTYTEWHDSDGTARIIVNGNDVHFTMPGVGRVTGQTGRYVETWTPDGGVEVTATHNADYQMSDVCAALS